MINEILFRSIDFDFMISKNTILNYDDNDSFDDYDVAVIDHVNWCHSFL